jgi:hypothetical protein
MSSIFCNCFLSHWVLLIYLFIIACFQSLSLGTDGFENLQELDDHNLGSKWESEASDPEPYCSNILSPSSIHWPHALIGYPSFHTLGLG